ncbi:PTS sugar transporter subunit IIA [Lacticaseibacillus daqingensis]|uniref:PTS sugar transporter subunit IIA n=1 Tax=Lacticaseibacillus daqingensis TaxID=2486014 RepID=UPI000F79E840|nr:hypothetical protein [Lacticaseibacillus daqingensis]
MRQIIIASHGKLAEGVENTLQLFTGNLTGVSFLSAYTEDGVQLDDQIEALMKTFDQDGALFFTDIKGGSVTQAVVRHVANLANVYVIAGFNFAMILEALMSTVALSETFAQKLAVSGREGIELIEVKQDASEQEDTFFE